jgi:hypothetical protein
MIWLKSHIVKIAALAASSPSGADVPADDNTVNKLRAANQTSRPCIIGHRHA